MKIEFFKFKNWIDLIMKKFYINWVIFIIYGGGISFDWWWNFYIFDLWEFNVFFGWNSKYGVNVCVW